MLPYPIDIEQKAALNSGESFEDRRYGLDVLLQCNHVVDGLLQVLNARLGWDDCDLDVSTVL